MTNPHSLRERLRSGRAQYGMWVASGDAGVAEICAGSGLDLLAIDSEHAPNDLRSVLAQLRAVSAFPIAPVVRPAVADTVLFKQYLDIGVINFLVPMIGSVAAAEHVVRAVRYPPRGVRGIGASLARSSRWGTDTDYYAHADDDITVVVQVEHIDAIPALADIAAVDGIDAVYLGPADLAGSMGLLGTSSHPDVVAVVEDAIRTIVATGKAAGVNTFDESLARRYADAGATILTVGADVTLLAKGAAELAARHRPGAGN